MPPAPPAPPSGIGWPLQLPTSAVTEVQISPDGQPLPPVPRQPGTQRDEAGSQMRPDVVPPQSLSCVQPQRPPDRHCAPERSAPQFWVSAVVHSRQVWLVPSQTSGAGQSLSTRQPTQRPLPASQCASGAAQSLSELQGLVIVHWPPLPAGLQVWPDGQPLRGAVPQPGWHSPPGPVQIRPESTAPQLWSVAQPQMPRSMRQAGSNTLQRVVLVAVHSLHEPASAPDVRQNGRSGLGQLGAPSPLQATQVWLVAEQSGRMPPQSAPLRQPTHTPTPDEVSHLGMAAAQCDVSVAVQAAQAPVGKQMGAPAGQSAVLPQGRQVWLAPSHTGVVPPHCALDTQATQVPEPVSQTGVASWQRVVLLAEQTPQAPEGWQAGSAPPHSLSPPQARQTWRDGSQIGADGVVQSASPRQVTQVPLLVSHSGVVPVQALALLAEHWPHAPDGSQAGVDPLHSPSPAQARHAWVAVLQTGVAPPHWLSVVQPTQVPDGTSQAGVAPPQAVTLLAEHWPQAPVGSQAGVAPPQSLSRAQARQTCVPPSQMGVIPPHWALLTQETQVPLPVWQ